MVDNYFLTAYKILLNIYRDKAYINLAVQKSYTHPKKNTILKIVNGVLEHHFLLSYYIKVLAKKTPQQAIRILLMQSIYCIKILQMKSSAIIALSLDTAMAIGKGELSGFISYCLNNTQETHPLPKNKKEAEQIQLNASTKLISLLKQDYPKAYKRILQAKSDGKVHIRLNENKIPIQTFEMAYPLAEPTACGYYVTLNDSIKRYLNRGDAFVQSLTSGYAVLACGDVAEKKVLDMCAAPGGKSVYLAQRGAQVTACDIYEHKLQLIKRYARKACVSVQLVLQDNTQYHSIFSDAFDCVLLDAPCSGTGVLAKRQDARLKEPDIDTLTKLQDALLANGAQYLKKGGILVYSTCSVLKAENEQMITRFLQKMNNFVLQKITTVPYNNQGMLQFLPDGKLDGFFIARMQKV